MPPADAPPRPSEPAPREASRRAWQRPGAAIALAAYMGLIFYLSSTPDPPLPQMVLHLWDKLLHLAEYLLLGFLWAAAVRGSIRRRLLLGWLAAGLFGLTDELHQSFVPGRDASLLDWIADALGSGLGAAIAAFGVSGRWLPGRKKSGPRPKVSPELRR